MVTRRWNFNIQIWDRTQFNPSQYRHSGTNLRCTITYFIVYLVFIRQLLVQELGKSREKLTKFPPLWSTDNKGRKDISWRALFSQSYGFSSSHVWMWELEYKGGWALKNGCFWTAVLEKTLESPLDSKEIQPVHFEGDQPWDFFGRNDAEAESPILWPPHEKRWLIGKDSDAGMPPIPIHFSTGFWLFPWHLYPNIPLPLGVCPQQSSPCVSHQHKSLTSLPPSLASCFSQ